VDDPRSDLYQRVVEAAPFGVLFFVYGVCIEANPEVLRLLGCSRSQVVGHPLDTLRPEDPVALISLRERVAAAVARGEQQSIWELRTAEGWLRCLLHLRPGTGTQRHELLVSLHAFPRDVEAPRGAEVLRGAAVPGRAEVSGGAGDRRRSAAGKEGPGDSADSAYLDPLTRLPTRLAMLDHLCAWRTAGKTDRCAALLLFDLDHFKDINDSWGHDVGDHVLARVARILERQLAGSGLVGAFLARQAGDEFLLFVPELADSVTEAAVRARALADTLRKQLAVPIFVDGNEFVLTASIGISLLSDAQLPAERALQYADTAMYAAKRRGRDSCAFFDRAIAARAQRQVALNARLRKAVDNQEFALYVQPLVSIADGRLIGGEVLLRWINGDQAASMPAEFIPLLESSGLIVDVGHWVIRTACEVLRGYQDGGFWRPDMQLHVNVSRRQFQDPRLLQVIRHSLYSYDLAPGLIAFEITETLAMEDVDATVAKMEAIKSLGAGFAIDDFGIGYSSMSALRRLPFDSLKIDREFVRHMHRDADARGIVEAILAMSRQYGLEVIAEGVEDAATLELLQRIGCDGYQGALYSMPVPVDRFELMLAGDAAA